MTLVYLAIIILNVNGLHSPFKMHMVAEWIMKQDSTICYLEETHSRFKDTYTQSEGIERIFQANENQKKNRDNCKYIRGKKWILSQKLMTKKVIIQ